MYIYTLQYLWCPDFLSSAITRIILSTLVLRVKLLYKYSLPWFPYSYLHTYMLGHRLPPHKNPQANQQTLPFW